MHCAWQLADCPKISIIRPSPTACDTVCCNTQLYRAVAEAPNELNKTRGIGIIEAPPDFVASVIADDYESWDSTIKDLKILKSERDPATGALVEIIWSRYCLRECPLPPIIYP